jgi:hypothetical protein
MIPITPVETAGQWLEPSVGQETTPSRSRHSTDRPAPLYWVEPGTLQKYPTAFRAYRRLREAQEKPPARHRALAPDVEHELWRRRGSTSSPDPDMHLAVRPDTPPRIRRIVSEILRAIRRGQSAGVAISSVSRRFGLPRTRTLACMTAWLTLELGPPQDAAPS